MSKVKTLKRVFVAGSVRLDDPMPGAPLEDSIRLLSTNYPQFRWSQIYEDDGVVVGDSLEFRLQLPPPKVNG